MHIYELPLHSMKIFRNNDTVLPNSDLYCASFLSTSLPKDALKEVDYVAENFCKFFEK